MNKIIPIGKIWKSEANGWVYHRGGVSPTLCVGCHSGVQPKILVYEETDDTTGRRPRQDNLEH